MGKKVLGRILRRQIFLFHFYFLGFETLKSKLENTGVLSIVVYASLSLALPHPHQKQSKFITEKSENLS